MLGLLERGRFEVAVSVPLALEYEAVLLRHARELEIAPAEAIGWVDSLCEIGRRQEIHFLWRPTLTDPRDEFILELAVASGSETIVTHNIRDFRRVAQFAVTVLTPAEFLRQVKGGA